MNFSRTLAERQGVDSSLCDRDFFGDITVLYRAQAKKAKILSSPDRIFPALKTYYFSESGDDRNDGLSPQTPWKSLERYESSRESFTAGTAFLFCRGDLFRGYFGVVDGCFYGAYGTGDKPRIYTSVRNYAKPGIWQTENGTIWFCDARDLSGEPLWDIGQAVMDGGKAIGIKKNSLEQLTEPLDFYHDVAGAIFYLYAETDPSTLWSEIELAPRRHAIYGYGVRDITIENLCIRYAGAHGMGFADASDVTVRFCEIGWIGGSVQSAEIRFGNGIEFWNHCDRITVENSWVYQCYDAGLTHQAQCAVQTNIRFTDNLIEKCVYGIEFFVRESAGQMKNILYENNIIRFSGYGWGDQRIAPEAESALNGWRYRARTENFVIRQNIFEICRWYLLFLGYPAENGIVLTENEWIQSEGHNARTAFWQDETVLLFGDDFVEQIQTVDPKMTRAAIVKLSEREE